MKITLFDIVNQIKLNSKTTPMKLTLSDCDIELSLGSDILTCILTVNQNKYVSKIYQSDLKFIQPVELFKIIQLNHKQTQPFYTWDIYTWELYDQINNSTLATNLVMKISYSGDIYFDESIVFIQSNTTD